MKTRIITIQYAPHLEQALSGPLLLDGLHGFAGDVQITDVHLDLDAVCTCQHQLRDHWRSPDPSYTENWCMAHQDNPLGGGCDCEGFELDAEATAGVATT